MADDKTTVYEAGQLALTAASCTIYNAAGDKVAMIESPGAVSFFDGRVCHLNADGRVEDADRRFLGVFSEGKVFDHEHRQVGEAEGILAGPAAAALLAIRATQKSAGQDLKPKGFFPKMPEVNRPDREPTRVVVHQPSEPMDPWVSLFLWLALIGIVITIVVMALVFVAITSPVWGGMMVLAVVSLRMLIWTHTESLDHDWPSFSKAFKIKQISYFMALSWGALSSAILTLLSRDASTPLMCLGAIGVGLLFIHRFFDGWGIKQLARRQDRAEGDPRPWVISTAAFLRARSPIVVSSAGGSFALAFVLSGTVFANKPTSVIGQVTSAPQTMTANSPDITPSSTPDGEVTAPVDAEPEDGSVPESTEPEPSVKSEPEPERKGLPSKSADLASLSMFELDCLRNEPYARRGYKFKRDDLRQFFSKQSWYKPTTSDQEHLWNQMSKAEQDFIVKIKNEQSRRGR